MFLQIKRRNLKSGIFFVKESNMTRKSKVIVLSAITALVLSLPLSAQYVQDGTSGLGSNTANATAGRFGTDVDDYMDYHSYSDVKFDKWFGFATWDVSSGRDISGGSGWDSLYKASLGFATKVNDLYLGVWYNGNIVKIEKGQYSETITPVYNDVNQMLTSTTKVTNYHPLGASAPYVNSTNQLEFLIGLAGHGIKVGFLESMAKNKLKGNRDWTVTNTLDGYIKYADEPVEFDVSGGHLYPYLGWGSSFGALRPYVEVGLDIWQEKKIDTYKTYNTFLGKKFGVETTNREDGWNKGYLSPSFSVGADFDLSKTDTTKTTIGLGYGMSVTLYNNSYDASGISGSVKGPVSWDGVATTVTHYANRTETNITSQEIDYYETLAFSHDITPALKISSDLGSGFKLGFKLGIPIYLATLKSDHYKDTYTINKIRFNQANVNKTNNTTTTDITHENLGLEETTSFGIGAQLGLGVTYQLVPDHFTLNAGISTTPVYFNRSVIKTSPNGVLKIQTTKVVNGNGETTANTVVVADSTSVEDKVATDASWEYLQFGFSGGFEFRFTPQVALDMALTTNGNWNVFNLTNVNVMFTFNF